MKDSERVIRMLLSCLILLLHSIHVIGETFSLMHVCLFPWYLPEHYFCSFLLVCMYHKPCPPTGCRYPIWKCSAHFHSRNGGCGSGKLALHRPPKNLLDLKTRNWNPRRCYDILSTKFFWQHLKKVFAGLFNYNSRYNIIV